ncbi:hypothetical protein T484DRAFT_1744337 [Baffinella frigidus]|nr:hypothetical protein T484DRAFT_1744337 [Cryptophyta sp. CCMP2293]
MPASDARSKKLTTRCASLSAAPMRPQGSGTCVSRSYGCVLEKIDGNVCIVSVLKSGAAACSGTEFCEGDVIMQVDERAFASSSSCETVASALRGKVHTGVRLWIQQKISGKIVSARIVRQPVPGKPIKDAVLEFGHLIPVLTPQNDPARRSLHNLPGAAATPSFLAVVHAAASRRRESAVGCTGHVQREKRRGAANDLREPRALFAPCLGTTEISQKTYPRYFA